MGKAAKFAVGAVGRALILTWCSRQGLMWASQAACTMLHYLVDNIWISFGATDAPKSAVKDLGHFG